jgi:hypothetical protein
VEAVPSPARPRPVFGVVSIVCAVLTFAMPAVLIWLMAEKLERDGTRDQGWGALAAILLAMVVALVGALVPAAAGTIAGIVALARRERRAWVAVIGLVVCGGVLTMLAVALLNSQKG